MGATHEVHRMCQLKSLFMARTSGCRIFLRNRKVLSDLQGLWCGPSAISPERETANAVREIRRKTMIRMIRVSAIAIAASIAAANLTSPASAQAFSQTWGTGNVEATHYDANGRLARDSVSQNPTIARDQGLSAFAASPRKVHRSRGH